MIEGASAGRPDIRLIACDMDGTLLDSRKRLPPRFDQALSELHRRGIRFVISSGRQYYNLLTVMQGRVEGLTYIADNGAMAFEGGHNLFADELDLERLRRVPPEGLCRVKGPLGLFLGLGRVEPEAGQLRFVKSFLEQEGTP